MSRLLSSLPVGALVKDTGTKYNGETIIWRVLEHDHDAPGTTSLEARDILTLKCFDAKEPNNSDNNRKHFGNNRYLHSNILQWLNSDAAANAWYSAQHNADQKPDSSNVWEESGTPINPYDTEAGFLTNFSAELKAALQTVTKTTAKNTVTDGGGYESVSRKIFLLSTTEVGLANENNVAEGSIYAYYSQSNTNDRRKKNLANDAAKGNHSSATSPWYWWLRTPYSGYSNYALFVLADGSHSYSSTYAGSRGVAPGLCILSSLKVSDTPDADGAYTIEWPAKYISSTGAARFANHLKLNTLAGTLYGGVVGEYWLQELNLPFVFQGGAAIIYNGELHIMGGAYGPGGFTNHYKWDGTVWTSVSTLPYHFANGRAVIYDNKIHILGGGTGGSGYSSDHYAWDGTSWTSVSDMDNVMAGSGDAIVYNNKIYLIGTGPNGTVIMIWDGSDWVVDTSTLSKSYDGCSVVVYDNKIHILGGATDIQTAHSAWNGSIGSTWETISTLPYNFCMGSAVVYNDEIHILGSIVSNNEKCHYKWDGTSWDEVSELPYNFRYKGAVVYDNKIHILYGTNHYKFIQQSNGWIQVVDEDTEEVLYHTQGVDIEGLSADDIVIVSYDPTQMGTLGNLDEMTKAGIYCVLQEDETLGFIALKFCPSMDIPITATIQGGSTS